MEKSMNDIRDGIINEARSEAKRIIEEAQRKADSIVSLSQVMGANATEKAKLEAEAILIKAKREKDLMTPNENDVLEYKEKLADACLFVKVNSDSMKFKNVLSKIDNEIKAKKEWRKKKYTEAIRNETGTNFINPYEMIGLQNMATSFFDVLAQNLCKNVMKYGISSSIEKLLKAKEMIEGFVPKTLHFHFNNEYIEMYIEELTLNYKKGAIINEEKERRREESERMREEIRARREFERELKRARKDEEDAANAIRIAKERADKDDVSNAERARLLARIEKLQASLEEAQRRSERALSMAQQTRSGYVYVISNIGSFGEGVFKIGMTRRIDPMERVIELGDASVPFPFDVHAMIYCEDAPALENALHKAFQGKKLNMINGRKEFFRVSLEEIKAQISATGLEVEFVEEPLAQQWRDSQMTLQEIV